MNRQQKTPFPVPPPPRTWDARLARWLVTPLADTAIVPNHLTTIRFAIGLCGAASFAMGTFGWINLGALLIVLSNFADHTDGELARISGKTSKLGHCYDMASDAVVTVALFVGAGIGVGRDGALGTLFDALPGTAGALLAERAVCLGALAGVAVALIFYLRMRIEAQDGKAGTQQSSFAGFETEDVLYLLPLVTLFNGLEPFLIAAAIGAPLFAAWVVLDYWRMVRRQSAAGTDLRALQ